jgi:hypothetical protein
MRRDRRGSAESRRGCNAAKLLESTLGRQRQAQSLDAGRQLAGWTRFLVSLSV